MSFFYLLNYFTAVLLVSCGLYIIFASDNLVKKLVGLSIFQTAAYLVFVSPGKVFGGTAPILDSMFSIYSSPLPHVLILTAIVVGVATLALGLAIVIRIKESFGTVIESKLLDERKDRF